MTPRSLASRFPKTVLCLAFATALVASLAIAIPARAATSDEVRAEAERVMKELDGIQSEINSAQAAYDSATEAQKKATEAMEEAQKRGDDAKERMEKSQAKLRDRAIALYRSGQPTIIDVLLESSSFEEFAGLSTLMDAMNVQDAKLVETARAAKAEAEAARAEYESQKTEAEAQMKAAADAKAQLSAKAEEMQAEVKRLTAEAAELQAQEEAAAAEAAAAAAAAEAASQQYSGGGGGGSYSPSGAVVSGSGQFTHPCPGSSYISSSFGYRDFDSSFHKGTDFAASQGTPIYAADAGTVVIAGYSNSAGNWVVISHGGGLTTKYMHMAQLPFVSAGQSVSKGQNIGVVGTTGYSTGPHLHFQVEVDGTAVDPMYYL